jgi:predicted nucleic acid-binding protein
MGLLTIPKDGCLYLDASILIYSVERHPQFAPPLDSLWTAIAAGTIRATTSELTILETLVLPFRATDKSLVGAYEKAFAESGIELLPVSRSVLRRAAELRAAKRSLRTPDAIHLATAESQKCSGFLTNDRRLSSLSSIPCIVLSEVPT